MINLYTPDRHLSNTFFVSSRRRGQLGFAAGSLAEAFVGATPTIEAGLLLISAQFAALIVETPCRRHVFTLTTPCLRCNVNMAFT